MPKPASLVAILDDDPFVRKALERLIRSGGYRAESFSSGDQFLRSVDDHKPDCLVLDLHMPGMDGAEVQARLTQAGAGVPVVVVTGYDTPESRSRMLAGGAIAYLSKPVDGQTLLSAIALAIHTLG